MTPLYKTIFLSSSCKIIVLIHYSSIACETSTIFTTCILLHKSVNYCILKLDHLFYNCLMNNLLSVKQVAFILRVHPLTVRRYIRDKRLKAVKVGGNIRVDENALQDFHKEVSI